MMALRVGKDLFDYVNDPKAQKSRLAMKRRLQDYYANKGSVSKMERIDEKYYLIVFSADWCSDCISHVPGLAKSLMMANNNLLTARVVDYDNYRDMADEFNIKAIPTVIVFDKAWKEIGRFVESPRKFGSVEEEICAILDSKGTVKA